MDRPKMIKPGMFGGMIAADTRRSVFDYHNEVILAHRASIDFIFIGDSITDMWDLDTYFGKKSHRIVNRGIGGDMTSYVLRRFPADVLQLKPKHVIIKIGINNTWTLDAWREIDRQSPEQIRKEVISDIIGMVKISKDNGIIPIVCSLLPTRIDTDKQIDVRNQLVIEINQELKIMMESQGLIFINYHSHMTDDNGKALRTGLSEDGLHPHVIGYNVMADVLRSGLNQHNIGIS